MCRSTDYHGYSERDRLRIKAFFIRFSGLNTSNSIPESITLVYLPRINETGLDVSGSKIRPDSPAFVTLYRIVNADTKEGEAVYGSREPVRASDGVRFEVHLREEKVLKGVFRKDEEDEWKLDCKSEMERDGEVAVADIYVAVEGHVAMSERVKMVRKRNMRRTGFNQLEEIPEVESESDGGSCCTCGESDGGEECGGDSEETDIDIEGFKWAVDLGIWVMCLGVGYLVTKASTKSLRRRSMFF